MQYLQATDSTTTLKISNLDHNISRHNINMSITDLIYYIFRYKILEYEIRIQNELIELLKYSIVLQPKYF